MMALEEGGKAVNNFLEAMKSQPLALALCVMNFLLLGFLYYTGITAANERHLELQLLYNNRSEVAQLLASCYPAPPQGR